MPDEHGQPARQLRAGAITERTIDELLGLCRGVLADGVLVQEEVEFLSDWLCRHRNVASTWPANVLIERIGRVLDDGVMDADEEGDLVQLLMQIEGGRITDATSASMSTTLPVDEPPPTITFIGSNFCVTGKFACGSRREVENTIQNLGGTVISSVSARTTYLVIGEIGSRDWIHSTYGRKIEHAMELRNTGHSLAIIAESWWYQATKGNLISEHP